VNCGDKEVRWVYKLYTGPGNFKEWISQHKVKRIGLKIVDNLVGNLIWSNILFTLTNPWIGV
jgi:hypothetical protein